MKRRFFLLFALSPFAVADSSDAPAVAALTFNQWYIAQLNQDKPPVLNPDIMNDYVTSETVAAIKAMYSGDSNEKICLTRICSSNLRTGMRTGIR